MVCKYLVNLFHFYSTVVIFDLQIFRKFTVLLKFTKLLKILQQFVFTV